MLASDQDFDLYPTWGSWIEAEETRAAFFYLVGIAACSKQFTCHAQWKGEIRDYRFIEIGGSEQPFSFITNQRWLLFYFRPPALRSGQYSRKAISEAFNSFSENSAGEWTVKLRNICDVDRLVKLLSWY